MAAVPAAGTGTVVNNGTLVVARNEGTGNNNYGLPNLLSGSGTVVFSAPIFIGRVTPIRTQASPCSRMARAFTTSTPRRAPTPRRIGSTPASCHAQRLDHRHRRARHRKLGLDGQHDTDHHRPNRGIYLSGGTATSATDGANRSRSTASSAAPAALARRIPTTASCCSTRPTRSPGRPHGTPSAAKGGRIHPVGQYQRPAEQHRDRKLERQRRIDLLREHRHVHPRRSHRKRRSGPYRPEHAPLRCIGNNNSDSTYTGVLSGAGGGVTKIGSGA